MVQRLQEMLATYRAMAAASSPGPPLPPLPIGGPEEAVAPVPPSPGHALISAMTRGNAAAPTGAPTPDESRHSQRTGPTATVSGSGSRCSSAHHQQQQQQQQQAGGGTASPVHSPPRCGPSSGLSREIVPVSEDSGGSGAAGEAAAAVGVGRAGGGSRANGNGPGDSGGGWAMLGFRGRRGPGRAGSSVATAAESAAGGPGLRPGAHV